MDSTARQLFHEVFIDSQVPDYLKEDFAFFLFQRSLILLSERLKDRFKSHVPNPEILFQYILNEYAYYVDSVSEEKREELHQSEMFQVRLIRSIVDKMFFNEYLSYKARPLISPYSPLISTYTFFLNFILNRYTVMKVKQNYETLILDILRKAFLMSQGVCTLLVDGFETEAFSTWRTIHEIECVAKILFDHPYLYPVYMRHIQYNRAFRDEFEDKKEQQIVFDEIKSHMKKHELRSKDLKKYIEYGWLYSIKNSETLYPGLKLNFRNGVEMIAELSEYASLYEMSSEIAHSSPILIYSNKVYFKDITIIALYETFLRIEIIFQKILSNNMLEESASYFSMRDTYIEDMKLMLQKEKILFAKKQNQSNIK